MYDFEEMKQQMFDAQNRHLQMLPLQAIRKIKRAYIDEDIIQLYNCTGQIIGY